MEMEKFISGKIKNLLHTVALFTGLIFILGLLGYALLGPKGIAWAIGLSGVILLITPHVSPRLVLKIYRARELTRRETPQLHKIVTELARRAELPTPPRLYAIPSAMLNAFSVGTPGSAAIGITEGLLRSMSTREIIAILAHETGHIRHNDMRVMGFADIISRLTGAFSTFGQILLLLNLPLILMGKIAVPWLVIFLLIFAPALSSLLQLALSRTREFDADLDAVLLTNDPQGLADALRKLERQTESLLKKILLPGYRIPAPSLLRTHPGVADRVKKLRELTEARENPFGAFNDHDERSPSLPGAGEKLRRPKWRITGLWY